MACSYMAACFVQEVLTAIGYLCVDRFSTVLLAGALCNSELGFKIPVEALCLYFESVGASHQVFEPEVNAKGRLADIHRL